MLKKKNIFQSFKQMRYQTKVAAADSGGVCGGRLREDENGLVLDKMRLADRGTIFGLTPYDLRRMGLDLVIVEAYYELADR